MASTLLSDVIIPEVYATYTAVDSPETTAFYQSGIVTQNAMLQAKANEGGNILTLPFWKDLDATAEPNLSNDNPADIAVPQKVTAGEQIARMVYLNQSYSAADLVGEIAGSSPMQQVRNRFGTYWQRQWNRRIIAMSVGLLADNVAANGGDMVNDISIEDGNNAAATNLFSRSGYTGSIFTLGDAFGEVGAIAVHSVVYKRMVDNNDIDFIRPSDGTPDIPMFLGSRVIVDDSMPVVAGGTSGYKYTSVLFGSGAFGYGEGTPDVPMATKREELQGNGGGIDIAIERKSWLLHPFGYKAVGTPAAGEPGYTLAELKLATTWERVVERKNVPMAFLVTNG